MGMSEDRLSTTVVDAAYILPETTGRWGTHTDREAGPIALVDTSGGMNNQEWVLSYIDPIFTLTPQTTGSPSTALSVANATQVTFCFDQNARPTIAYVIGGSAFLYWYDSSVADFVTTEYVGYVGVMLSLDDKRAREVGINDILFWYTMSSGPGVYDLYHRKQRDRFEIEYPMALGCFPYFNGAGMHKGLRGKIVLTSTLL